MVDFKKRVSGSSAGAKPIVPAEIYEKADRASDTGPLRPAPRVLSPFVSQPVSQRHCTFFGMKARSMGFINAGKQLLFAANENE
jgi:hypothetical protein